MVEENKLTMKEVEKPISNQIYQLEQKRVLVDLFRALVDGGISFSVIYMEGGALVDTKVDSKTVQAMEGGLKGMSREIENQKI